MMKTPLSNAWLPRLAYCLTFSFSFSFTVNNLLPFTLSYYSRLHHSWYYMISFIFIISIYTFLPKLNYMILLHTMKPIACRYDNNNILKLFCAKPWGEFSDNMPRQGSWAVDASRCKRLQESVEATFMGEAVTILLPCLCLCVILSFCFFNFILFEYMQPWTVMIYSISRSKWKLRRMQNASYVELRNGHLLRLRYPFMFIERGRLYLILL